MRSCIGYLARPAASTRSAPTILTPAISRQHSSLAEKNGSVSRSQTTPLSRTAQGLHKASRKRNSSDERLCVLTSSNNSHVSAVTRIVRGGADCIYVPVSVFSDGMPAHSYYVMGLKVPRTFPLSRRKRRHLRHPNLVDHDSRTSANGRARRGDARSAHVRRESGNRHSCFRLADRATPSPSQFWHLLPSPQSRLND